MLSPFRYPGGKNRYLSILMKYIEPMLIDQYNFTDLFVGGGSVLLEIAKKYPNHTLYANDKNYWMYCFWKVISDIDSFAFNKLMNLIEFTPTLIKFNELRKDLSLDEIDCAYKAIFFNRTTFSGILNSGPIGGKTQSSKYSIDCRYNIKTLKKQLTECRNLLKGRIIVSNLNFSDHIQIKTNNPIYLDPPYFKMGKYLYSEYMTNEEHLELYNLLKNRNNWVLSYDDCDEIRKIYLNHNIINMQGLYSVIGKKTTWDKKNELIIVNNEVLPIG
jgi:DNA adenine methylase